MTDPISGVTPPILPPPNPIEEGRRFGVIDMGRFSLAQSAGNEYKTFSPNFKGRIVSTLVIVETATTDANADATIRPRINGTAVTGGVATIADKDDGTNPFITVDKVFQGTLVTADNAFKAGDLVKVQYGVTNAFSDGEARVLFVIEAYDD